MTERKTLYLHVGTHKTGTTAIQALLTTRSDAFAQAGLFVPQTGRIDEASGHYNIAWGHQCRCPLSPRIRDLGGAV